jgi:hypothetical protein
MKLIRASTAGIPQLSALQSDDSKERYVVPYLPPHAAGQFL